MARVNRIVGTYELFRGINAVARDFPPPPLSCFDFADFGDVTNLYYVRFEIDSLRNRWVNGAAGRYAVMRELCRFWRRA